MNPLLAFLNNPADVNWLFRKCLYWLGGNWHGAEDCCQIALLRLLKAVDRFDGTRCKPRTYAYTVARRVAFADIKRRSTRKHSRTGPLLSDPVDRRHTPAMTAELTEQATAARASLSVLPERSRDIIEGRADGLTLQDLGDRYGVTRESVRQRQDRSGPVIAAEIRRRFAMV